MSAKTAAVLLCCAAAVMAAGCTTPEPATSPGPLVELTGTWDLRVFVIGGGDMGMLECGESVGPGPGPPVTVSSSADGAASLSFSCVDGSDYSFHLKLDAGTDSYLITVESGVGISVSDFPVRYADGEGWHGVRDELVDGEMVSTAARVQPIEGRNWSGWTIQVLPAAARNSSSDPIRTLKADLTRRK